MHACGSFPPAPCDNARRAPVADAAGGLCRYQMYAQRQKWKVQLVSQSGAERGGLKECILQVKCLAACVASGLINSSLCRVQHEPHIPVAWGRDVP